MNLEALKDKSIAMVVWNAEKEEDVHVYLGKLHLENDENYFINEEKGWKVSLDKEQLNRVRPVPDELKETLLNADYALSMSIGNLPDTDNTADYQKTGMKWSK